MGKRHDEPDEPTLELPSFFRRRKRPAGAASTPDPEPDAPPEPGGRRAARAARPPRTRSLLSPGAASMVAGALVGIVGTGLTWAALRGCEALRGTDSCGGSGLLVLVAILALMVVAGALLLKAMRVSEPNATSFLGIGLMTVILLVTLMESLFSVWMFLAVPVLTALSYLAAQWVSTRFVDTEKSSPGVDIR